VHPFTLSTLIGFVERSGRGEPRAVSGVCTVFAPRPANR
jgi:hypothetical protein